MKYYTLEELIQLAKDYCYEDLPIFFSDDNKYTRVVISKDEHLEVVVICFGPGQTSTVHDHQGSNCVIRVVDGKILETLFKENNDSLEKISSHYINKGEVSGLDGVAVHQISNISKKGTVLLNFYSPPFA
jgi:cysteine dioxygenase